MNDELISRDQLIEIIAKKANITINKAKEIYECILNENPSFRKSEMNVVETVREKSVPIIGDTVIKEIRVTSQVPVKTIINKESIKPVEVKRELTIPLLEKKEVAKGIEVSKEKVVELIQTVEVMKPIEIIKEVPVEVIKTVEVIKEVEIIKEIPVEVIKEKEIIKEIEVIVEVPVEVIKEVEIIKEVIVEKEIPVEIIKEVIKEIEVIKEVPIEVIKEITVFKEVEIIKEIPIEIIREIEVVKSIDFESLKKMMGNLKTVEISKQVIGETRTSGEAKTVGRRTLEPDSKILKKSGSKKKKDDLKKVVGISLKIEKLLNKTGIKTFKKLSKTKTKELQEILDNAGPRYHMHDPNTWSKQAKMAHKGNWEELKMWQDELDGGK